MELPFAVDYASSEMAAAAPSPWTVRNPERTSATVTAEDDDSLVAASSQGSSFCASASEDMDPPVPRRVTASVVPATAPHRSAAAPPLPATDEGLASVLSQYGVVEPEAGVDAEFTYVNVGDAAEDDDDECRILTSQDLADGPELGPWRRHSRQDVLALLLTDTGCEGDVDIEALVRTTELAQSAVLQACNAKKEGNLPKALEEHAAAASLYRTAARSVQTKNGRFDRVHPLIEILLLVTSACSPTPYESVACPRSASKLPWRTPLRFSVRRTPDQRWRSREFSRWLRRRRHTRYSRSFGRRTHRQWTRRRND